LQNFKPVRNLKIASWHNVENVGRPIKVYENLSYTAVFMKTKKWFDTLDVTGGHSIERAHTILRPQSNIIETQAKWLKQFQLHEQGTSTIPTFKYISSHKQISNLPINV
jgi:hypothetical protein